MARPPRLGVPHALAALFLIFVCLSPAALAVGQTQAPQHRLADDGGLGGGAAAAATTTTTSPLPPPRASSSAHHHQQHENPLETVRFDLAAASLAAAAASARRRNQENGLLLGAGGAGDVRLAVNASFFGGGKGGPQQQQQQEQVVHALPSTRAAEALRVSWSGLQDARPDDLIVVLLLEGPPPPPGGEQQGGKGAADFLASAAPAKFSLLGASAAANGSLELRLANYLAPYVAVALFRGGPAAPALAEGAPVVVLRNGGHPFAPLHRRLSLAAADDDGNNGNSNSNSSTVALAVRWTTRLPGGTPGVWWTDEPPGTTTGPRRRSYKRFARARGPALTYSRGDLCAGGDATGVGFSPPGHFHTAVMSGLEPGRTYWYVVGDASSGGRGDGFGAGSSPPPPDEGVRSPEAAFVAPPSSSSSSGAFSDRVRVLVTADMGQAEPDGWSQTPDYTRSSSVRTAQALAREVDRSAAAAAAAAAKKGAAAAAAAAAAAPPPPYSLVLHAGDISYARGYGALWAAFHDLVEPIASRAPYMLAPGNHEVDWPSALGGRDRFSAESGEAGARASPPRPEGGGEALAWRAARGGKPARDAYDSGGECGVAYARRFAMPTAGAVLGGGGKGGGDGGGGGQKGDDGRDKPWYALDHGPHLRFVVFSTEHDFMPGSEQRAFLERAFAGARDRGGDGASNNSRPWLVLVGHRPMHVCSSWDGFSDSDGAVSRALRASLDPLLSRYAVDLTIAGHHHSLGRTCAVLPSSSSSSSQGGGGEGGGAEEEPLGPVCAPEGQEEERGVVHLVAGNGGAPISLNPSFPPSPIWRRLRYDWGYLRLDATRERLAIEGVAVADGEVVDRFELWRREGRGL